MVLYQRHGDAQLLDDQWSSMASWLTAFSDRAGVVLDFPDGGFRSVTGWTPQPPDNRAAARTPLAARGHPYLARSAGIMAEAAGVLGRTEEAGPHAELAK